MSLAELTACRPSDVEQCDGCGRSGSACESLAIGDASILVCAACHAAATAMVFTELHGSAISANGTSQITSRGEESRAGWAPVLWWRCIRALVPF